MNVAAFGGWMEVVLLGNECELGVAKCLMVSNVGPPAKQKQVLRYAQDDNSYKTYLVRNICL